MKIYIDESGTLPDKKDSVVIVAAVGTNLPSKLEKITTNVRKTLKNKNISEIKFYRSGENTKVRFLKLLAKEKVEIFIFIVEKKGKSIPDTPENFALLCWPLVEDCLMYYKAVTGELIFDRHFHSEKDQKEFNRHLMLLTNKNLVISHQDSQKNPAINTADMVAGSMLWEETNKEDKFYLLISPKIIVKKIMRWEVLKKQLWQEKTHPNRRKRPSEVSI